MKKQNMEVVSIVLKFKDEIDVDILRYSINSLRYKYPLFYIYLDNSEVNGYKNNPYPIRIRNSWDPSYLGAEETNYHLVTFKYKYDKLAIEASNSYDIDELIGYVKSVVLNYVNNMYKDNIDFNIDKLDTNIIDNNYNGDEKNYKKKKNYFIKIDKNDLKNNCEMEEEFITSLLHLSSNNLFIQSNPSVYTKNIKNNVFDDVKQYIDELYLLDVNNSDITCNITNLNNNYYLVITQNLENDLNIKEFLRILDSYNIKNELIDSEDLRLSNIVYEDIKCCTRRLIR